MKARLAIHFLMKSPIMRHMLTRFVLYVTLVVASAWALACNTDDPTDPAAPAGVEALRTSLAPFTSLTLAKEAGYEVALTDCMSNGDLGAMGVHFGNPSLIDGTVDAMHP